MPRVLPRIVPALEIPPVNVAPVTEIAVAVELILPVLLIKMPWLEPRIMPLSTIAPVMVLPAILIPVAATILPELLILPPLKVGTAEIKMPTSAPVTVPALVMPPPKDVTPTIETTVPGADSKPALEMPPANVGPVIEMAGVPALVAEIVLWLSILMPPNSVPESTIDPVMVVFFRVMPVDEIRPLLTMPALVATALICVLVAQTPEMVPVFLDGNGPLKQGLANERSTSSPPLT